MSRYPSEYHQSTYIAKQAQATTNVIGDIVGNGAADDICSGIKEGIDTTTRPCRCCREPETSS
ncbi:MAG: hypothetical protein ACU85V_07175, partial [Gammaproteobacteria bacterium]